MTRLGELLEVLGTRIAHAMFPELFDDPHEIVVGVYVGGGCLREVRSNVPVRVVFFDEDNYAQESPENRAVMEQERAELEALPIENF